jgi:hypothetical protein
MWSTRHLSVGDGYANWGYRTINRECLLRLKTDCRTRSDWAGGSIVQIAERLLSYSFAASPCAPSVTPRHISQLLARLIIASKPPARLSRLLDYGTRPRN